jgi:hypothetical protein
MHARAHACRFSLNARVQAWVQYRSVHNQNLCFWSYEPFGLVNLLIQRCRSDPIGLTNLLVL